MQVKKTIKIRKGAYISWENGLNFFCEKIKKKNF